MKTGDVVKHSGYAIKPKRDYWLGCGRYDQKNRAKEWLDNFVAERGTVIEAQDGKAKVQWDNGTISHCLDYMIEMA